MNHIVAVPFENGSSLFIMQTHEGHLGKKIIIKSIPTYIGGIP